MKPLLYIASAAILLSAGCSKNNDPTEPDKKEECGHGTTAFISVRTPEQWQSFKNRINAGDTEYESGYWVKDGKAVFSIGAWHNRVCPKEPATIIPQLITLIDDNTVSFEATAEENSGDPVQMQVPKANTVYKGENLFAFSNTDSKQVSLSCAARCSFPTKGSWSADSTYFFDFLLDDFSIKIYAKGVEQ
jgi:hypothetical protein